MIESLNELVTFASIEWGTFAEDIRRYVRWGDLPFTAMTAVDGIMWALSTGRLAGQIDLTIRALDRAGRIALVAEVAESCAVQADVPRFLIQRFA